MRRYLLIVVLLCIPIWDHQTLEKFDYWKYHYQEYIKYNEQRGTFVATRDFLKLPRFEREKLLEYAKNVRTECKPCGKAQDDEQR